jgi:uncharacterized protein with ParB-like and HNH nuclease domain
MSANVIRQVQPVVQTAREIVTKNACFVIPSYQRPYVWSPDDVEKLLDNIEEAMNHEKQTDYFIGTVISSRSLSDEKTVYELVDGQQRITTLMLMAMAFAEVFPSAELTGVAVYGKQPRLQFAILDKVQQLLGAWAGIEGLIEPDLDTNTEKEFLSPLIKAKKTVANWLDKVKKDEKKGEEYLKNLDDFIFHKVSWVNNVMPEGMDLNRLFVTMNTGGVQL